MSPYCSSSRWWRIWGRRATACKARSARSGVTSRTWRDCCRTGERRSSRVSWPLRSATQRYRCWRTACLLMTARCEWWWASTVCRVKTRADCLKITHRLFMLLFALVHRDLNYVEVVQLFALVDKDLNCFQVCVFVFYNPVLLLDCFFLIENSLKHIFYLYILMQIAGQTNHGLSSDRLF